MTASEAADLVRTLRWHLRLATVSRVLLISIVMLGAVAAFALPQSSKLGNQLWMAAMLAGVCWVVLAVFSAKQVRATNQASVYISTGRLDLAEQHLKDAMRIMSMYRTGKMLICHNLAVVAHGRKDYSAAAELCDGLIAAGVSASRSLGRMCRILLADCRLFLGETAAAMRAVAPLHLDDPALSLSERLMLLPIELRCQVSQGRFAEAADALETKVRLAEQLDSPKAALVHALLAGACGATGRADAATFLMRRAELYHDLAELGREYAILQDLPRATVVADNNSGQR